MKTPNFETDPIILNWVDRQVSSVREITNAVKGVPDDVNERLATLWHDRSEGQPTSDTLRDGQAVQFSLDALKAVVAQAKEDLAISETLLIAPALREQAPEELRLPA